MTWRNLGLDKSAGYGSRAASISPCSTSSMACSRVRGGEMNDTRTSDGGGCNDSSAMAGPPTSHSSSRGLTLYSFCKMPLSQTAVLELYRCTVTFLPRSSEGCSRGASARQYMQRRRNLRERNTGSALSFTPRCLAKTKEDIDNSPPASSPLMIDLCRARVLGAGLKPKVNDTSAMICAPSMLLVNRSRESYCRRSLHRPSSFGNVESVAVRILELELRRRDIFMRH